MRYAYALAAILCGAAFILLYKHYGLNLISLIYMFMIVLLAMTALTDIKEQLIPDKFAAACFVLGLVLVGINKEISIVGGVSGCLLCGGIMAIASLATRGGIGMGDAKLFAAIGMGLGLGDSTAVLMLSAIGSGLYGLALLCINMKNRKKTIPFAPFILVSVIIVLVF